MVDVGSPGATEEETSETDARFDDGEASDRDTSALPALHAATITGTNIQTTVRNNTPRRRDGPPGTNLTTSAPLNPPGPVEAIARLAAPHLRPIRVSTP